MKLLTTLAIALLVSGCASLFPPKYDTNQMYILARLSVQAGYAHESCVSPVVTMNHLLRLDMMTDELVTLSKYLPDNSETFEIAQILDEDIDEMIDRYVTPMGESIKIENVKYPSTAYCEAKMGLFKAKVDRTLEAVGKTQ